MVSLSTASARARDGRGEQLAALTAAVKEGGPDALVSAAGAGVDGLACAVVAWEWQAGTHPALSAKRRRQLVRLCRRPAHAARLVAAVLADPAAAMPGGGSHPNGAHSLGFFVVALRRELRRERLQAARSQLRSPITRINSVGAK